MSYFDIKVSKLHVLSNKKFRSLGKREALKLEALVNYLSTNESKFEQLVDIIFYSFETEGVLKNSDDLKDIILKSLNDLDLTYLMQNEQ